MNSNIIRRTLFILICIQFSMMGTAQSSKSIRQVKNILQIQAEAWNQGDIPAFMEYYWHSPKLQFIGSRGVTFGWQQTLDNYMKSYPDKATMGQLKFDIIDAQKLSRKVVMVSGKFTLFRKEKDDMSGHFLLVWKKIHGKWVIIADHTS